MVSVALAHIRQGLCDKPLNAFFFLFEVSKGRREFYTLSACRLENKRVWRDAERNTYWIDACIQQHARVHLCASVSAFVPYMESARLVWTAHKTFAQRDEHKSSRGGGGLFAPPVRICDWQVACTYTRRNHKGVNREAGMEREHSSGSDYEVHRCCWWRNLEKRPGWQPQNAWWTESTIIACRGKENFSLTHKKMYILK